MTLYKNNEHDVSVRAYVNGKVSITAVLLLSGESFEHQFDLVATAANSDVPDSMKDVIDMLFMPKTLFRTALQDLNLEGKSERAIQYRDKVNARWRGEGVAGAVYKTTSGELIWLANEEIEFYEKVEVTR